MKILQLNMWGGRLEDQILDLIKKEDPDIVCLQEAINVPGGRAAFFLTSDDIQKETNLDFKYFAPTFEANFMTRKMTYGNCILSKLPIIKCHTVFTYLNFAKNHDIIFGQNNMRNLQHIIIEHEKEKLNILNHHGYHIPKNKDGNDETLRQCKLIVNYIKKLEGPVILTGDFNLSPHSKSLEQINNILRNLSIEFQLKTTRNKLTHKTEVCDYIFINNYITVKDFRASEDEVSDHKALILEFTT